jgi:hypothetical protein
MSDPILWFQTILSQLIYVLLYVGPVSVPAKKRGGSYDRYYGGYGDPPFIVSTSLPRSIDLPMAIMLRTICR